MSRKRAHLAPQYLAWVRTMPCAGCGVVPGDDTPNHPHHHGPRGVGQKCDDFNTTPLCETCHRYFHDHGLLPGDTTRTATDLTLFKSQALLVVEYLRLQQAIKREAKAAKQANGAAA